MNTDDKATGSGRSTGGAGAVDLHVILARHREILLQPSILDELEHRIGGQRDWLSNRIRTSLAESAEALRVLDGRLDAQTRILEVGAGLGVTSAVLAAAGFDVVSIEPGGEGFEAYEALNPILRDAVDVEHPHYPFGIEELSDAELGTFDLVFSNNVIEHVPDPERALTILDGMLSPNGMMRHVCPNYALPFEPHFGLPLVPFRPQITAKVLPRRITNTGLWQSLNFITARQATSIGNGLGRKVEFVPGVMADTQTRLTSDEQFRERHSLLAMFARPLQLLGDVVRRLAPSIASSPMIFEWRRQR